MGKALQRVETRDSIHQTRSRFDTLFSGFPRSRSCSMWHPAILSDAGMQTRDGYLISGGATPVYRRTTAIRWTKSNSRRTSDLTESRVHAAVDNPPFIVTDLLKETRNLPL